MQTASYIALAVLWIWFLGAVTTYRIGKWLLVEGEGLRSVEFGMLAAFTAACVWYMLSPAAGGWVLLGLLCLWLAAQFLSHWYYTLFGASEKKLRGYNEWFRGTLRLFPASDTRLIPDLYHIILHLLLVINIVLILTVMIP